jgi:hypothetical protein
LFGANSQVVSVQLIYVLQKLKDAVDNLVPLARPEAPLPIVSASSTTISAFDTLCNNLVSG